MADLTAQQMAKALRLLADEKQWRPELRKTYRRVGKVGVGLARTRMRAGDRQLAAVAGRIRGTGTSTSAKISIPRGRPAAAVYGMRRPSGWLGNARHAGTLARNNPPWVGNSWTAATRGEGPRGINDALAEGEGKIVDEFQAASLDLMRRAFPGMR